MKKCVVCESSDLRDERFFEPMCKKSSCMQIYNTSACYAPDEDGKTRLYLNEEPPVRMNPTPEFRKVRGIWSKCT